eukprot:2373381-Rhodomonas_salina.2
MRSTIDPISVPDIALRRRRKGVSGPAYPRRSWLLTRLAAPYALSDCAPKTSTATSTCGTSRGNIPPYPHAPLQCRAAHMEHAPSLIPTLITAGSSPPSPSTPTRFKVVAAAIPAGPAMQHVTESGPAPHTASAEDASGRHHWRG